MHDSHLRWEMPILSMAWSVSRNFFFAKNSATVTLSRQ
jgi:hypothetical protein